MADKSKINSSTKSWANIVKEADPTPEPTTAYRFSNGRKFKEPKRV